MAKHGRGRGVSAGTVLSLLLVAASLFFGVFVYVRIAGSARMPDSATKLAAVIPSRAPQTQPPPIAEATEAPVETAEPEPTETPQTLRRITLSAVGQITYGQELRASGHDKATGQYDFAYSFADISHLLAADLSIATLRTTMAGENAGYALYNAPDALANALRSAGVNLVNLGTDRILDFGLSGLSATVGAAERAGLATVGASRTQAERLSPRIIEAGGVRIGILSVVQAASGTGRKAASQEEINFAINSPNAAKASEEIALLRAKGAEIIIALAHWGARAETKPGAQTQAIVSALAEGGADVILVTGPVAVQGFERRTVPGEYGNTREVFIAYSLGNFLIDDSRDTAAITGLVLRLNLDWDTRERRLTVAGAEYTPTWIMRWKDAGVNRYRVVPAGSAVTPEGMTDTIYINMKKSYQSVLTRLGAEIATPRAE